MADDRRMITGSTADLTPGLGPWRRFPAEGSPPSVRALLGAVPQTTLEKAWKSARVDLKKYVKQELDKIEHMEPQRRPIVPGFRPSEWPLAKVTRMIQVLLNRHHRGDQRVLAGVAVMLLELDRDVEEHLAAVVTSYSGEPCFEPPFLLDMESRFPKKPNAALAANVAWLFRGYGRSQVMQIDNDCSSPSQSNEMQTKPEAMAAELTDALAGLVIAVARMRELVGKLELAQPVTREEAGAFLERALQEANRVRSALAEAALKTPEASGAPIRTADQLEAIVVSAAAALRALAVPSGRMQLERLARELSTGRIAAKNALRRKTLERARISALQQASEGLTKSDNELAGFPGPRDEMKWLNWFWEIAGTGDDAALQISSVIEGTWPSIERFLCTVDIRDWSDDGTIEPGLPSATTSSPICEPPGSNATSADDTEVTCSAACIGPVLSVVPPDLPSSETCANNEGLAPTLPTEAAPETDSPSRVTEGNSSATTDKHDGLPSVVASNDSDCAVPSRSDSSAASDITAAPPKIESSTCALLADETPVQPGPTTGTHSAALVASPPVGTDFAPPDPQRPTDPSTRVELDIQDFSTFTTSHWVDQTGKVVQAPWMHVAFLEDALSELVRNLRSDNWATAFLLVHALNRIGAEQAPEPDDIERAFNLRARRWPPPDDEQQCLVAKARGLLTQTTFPSDVRHRLFVTTMLAAPVALHQLNDERIERLTTLAGFSSVLGTFLREWARVSRPFPDPFAALARQLHANGKNPLDGLHQAETQSRERLKTCLVELRSAAGNKVQRTHCRVAWDEFMIEARPILESALATPAIGDAQNQLGHLRKKATKIFERHEAKYRDRAVMDHAVDRLVDTACAVFRAASALSAATSETAELEVFPPSVTTPLSGDDISGVTDEELWLLGLFRFAVAKRHNLPTRVLDQRVITRHPWLLSAWPLNADASVSADASQCLDPLAASAYLLRTDSICIEAGSIRQWIMGQAPWLLAHFSSLNERERAIAEDFDRQQRDVIDECLSALRGYHVDLSELADRDGDRVSKQVSDIERIADGQYRNPLLIAAWARFLVDRVARHVKQTIHRVASSATQSGSLTPEKVDELVRHRRFASLHLNCPRTVDGQAPFRATPFRRDAELQWPEPRVALASLESEASQTGNDSLRSLIHDWCHASKYVASPLGNDRQQKLRELFLEVVFDLTAQRRKKKVTPSKSAHKVSCSDLASWLLPSSAQTPTFLPQIHRYSDLVIKVLAVSPADRSLPNKALALGEERSITVLLAPGLSAQLREETSRMLRQSPGKPIAVLDDLDLCRMLNPGGAQPNLVEALVELAVEQQRWNEFGPYEVQEGQHVRIEMYVGRRPEAERLVHGTTYSRIFSGRRLGKTALLRYVEHQYDRSTLASGKTLRVLYVPIVGLGFEDEVVAEIVGKLEGATGFTLPARSDPRSRLKAAIGAVLERKPDESYLVFLDEADTFFENQTRANELGGAKDEASLSWLMRTSESEKDSRQIPRIRFVVCGYRATNRSEGAWGNWGDVLLLNPLEPADAVQLVTGPLARIGVDARDQADGIAFRCGYQPAVIIYFCTRLLAELERRTAFTERDRRTVKAEDVVSVYQLPEVQDCVRETVWLNFVGDPLAQLTFAAFLAEAADLAPGAPIDDAPQRLLVHVTRETDEQALARWTAGSWQDLGARHLRDLVKRSLLAEAEHRPLSLRLRFPHQLSILLQESPQLRIRDALARLGASLATSGRRSEWLVPDDVLENMRWALSEEGTELGVRYVVFGSHWTEPFLDKSGLQHRLPEGCLLPRPATPVDLSVPVEHARVLVGGVDLLRTALRRQAEVGATVEIARLGRFSEDSINGYFKRVRGVEFSSPGALQLIMNATGGVPPLVQRFSMSFRPEATVDGAQLGAALNSVCRALPELAHELVKGPPDRRLDRRECELLLGVVATSSFFPDLIGEAMAEDDLLQEAVTSLLKSIPSDTLARPEVSALQVGDNERIALLLHLGLLIRLPLAKTPGWALSEVAPVPNGDVLRSLVPHIISELTQ